MAEVLRRNAFDFTNIIGAFGDVLCKPSWDTHSFCSDSCQIKHFSDPKDTFSEFIYIRMLGTG